jgi:Flp pilus assembly pilin Flp
MDAANMILARLHHGWWRLLDDQSGQTLLEYVMILTVMAIGVLGALFFFSDDIKSIFSSSGSSLPS